MDGGRLQWLMYRRQYQCVALRATEYQLSVIGFVLAPSGVVGPGNRREA
jgi:hypothetical protein